MTKKSLQEQIAEGVQRELARLGLAMPVQRGQAKQNDHVAFGSDEHRQLLGLVEVKEGDDTDGFVVFASPHSDRVFRLEDELGVVNLYPGVEPTKAATLMLRMKINELEGGKPEVPANAPRMWTPADAGLRASLTQLQ